MRKIILPAMAMVMLLHLEKCKFREFPDREPLTVNGRIMVDPDSALNNAEFTLYQKWITPGFEYQGFDGQILAEGVTDENGFFSVTYTANNKNYSATTCDSREAYVMGLPDETSIGLSMLLNNGNEPVFTCYPTNVDIDEIWYMSNQAELTIRLTSPLEANDTLFIDYAPSDTNDPHSFQFTSGADQNTRLFFIPGPVNEGIVATYLSNIKNPAYQGQFGNRRAGDVFRWGIGLAELRSTPHRDAWRPRGLPFADVIIIEN